MTKRTAVITGASRGIGRAIAMAFAEADYNVVINYNTNKWRKIDRICLD